MRAPKNSFKVSVAFDDFAFGIESRKDVNLTPEDIARELEQIVARIRNGGKIPPKA
jgi:hypothetical protein